MRLICISCLFVCLRFYVSLGGIKNTVEPRQLEHRSETKNTSSQRAIRVIGLNFSEILIKGKEIQFELVDRAFQLSAFELLRQNCLLQGFGFKNVVTSCNRKVAPHTNSRVAKNNRNSRVCTFQKESGYSYQILYAGYNLAEEFVNNI